MPCLASSQVHGEGFCSRAILGLSGGFSCTKNTKVMNEEHFPSTPLTGDVSLILQMMFLHFFQQTYVVAAAKGRSAPLAGAPTEEQEEDAKMFTTGRRNHGDHRGSPISESGDLMKMALLSTSLLWKSLVLVYLWMSFCCDFFRSWLSVAWCTFLGMS